MNNNINSNSGDPVRAIMAQASKQIRPLKRDADDHVIKAFFEVMSDVWAVADRLKLENRVSNTNFVMFGPQSVGKT